MDSELPVRPEENTMHWKPLSRSQQLATFIVVAALAAGSATLAIGSDHQDTPEVELNPKMDMTDVYAFPGTGTDRIALVMNSRAFLTPAPDRPGASSTRTCSTSSRSTTTATPSKKGDPGVFTGTGANQQVKVYGPDRSPGARRDDEHGGRADADLDRLINTVLKRGGMQVFAGPRDDPFFIDLEAAFCILPDRRPVTGPLSAPCHFPGGSAPSGRWARRRTTSPVSMCFRSSSSFPSPS